MNVSRNAFTNAVSITLADLPRLGIVPSLVAAITRDFGKHGPKDVVGVDPEWDDAPLPHRCSGPFLYDWSDADERDAVR